MAIEKQSERAERKHAGLQCRAARHIANSGHMERMRSIQRSDGKRPEASQRSAEEIDEPYIKSMHGRVDDVPEPRPELD